VSESCQTVKSVEECKPPSFFKQTHKHSAQLGSCLCTEAVQGAALSLESIDHVESSHSLPASVLSVGDGITDNVLKEDLEDTTSLLVDEAGDTLHTTTSSQTADSWLGNTLDVVAKNLAMALSTTLAEAFATFTTS
jgi:hypothetical protein